MKLQLRLLGAVMLTCSLTTFAFADPVRLGHTLNPAPAPIFVADLHGIFAEQGLDLQREIMTADPIIPAALLSGSLEMATISPTTFLAAVSNGLDLVAFAGTSITTAESFDIALVGSTASGIASAADFPGKSVGVPGIGSLLDVMLREWLVQKDVDPSGVTFIEVPFPQQGAQLQAGRVDAVIAPSQFAEAMTGQGHGQVIAHPVTELPEGMPTLIVASTRVWAEANPDAIAAFRAAVTQAQTISEADDAPVQAALAEVMNLPPEVAARVSLPVIDVTLTVEGLGFWYEAMQSQGALQSGLDLTTLVLP